MSSHFYRSQYCYKGQIVGYAIRGVLGGTSTVIPSGPDARYSTWHKRTAADGFFRVYMGRQQSYAGRGTDPLGTRLSPFQAARLKNFVHEWQLLDEKEKETWRKLATKWGMWRGYNLFLSTKMKGPI